MNLRIEADRDFFWGTCQSQARMEILDNLIHQDYSKMNENTNTIPDFFDSIEGIQEFIYEGFIDNNIAKYFMTYFLKNDYYNLGMTVHQVFESNRYDFIKFFDYTKANKNEKKFIDLCEEQDFIELGKLISGVFSTSDVLDKAIEDLALEKFND